METPFLSQTGSFNISFELSIEWCYVARPNKFARRGAFQTAIQMLNWHSQSPVIRRVRISLMRIDLLKAIGPEPAIIPVRKRICGDRFSLIQVNALPDRPIRIGHLLVSLIEFSLRLFISHVFPLSPATTKGKPLIPLPPRRRWKARLPRGRCEDKRIPWAADPPVPELNCPHYCRPSVGGTDQQESLHHQARDTLQGDEGD